MKEMKLKKSSNHVRKMQTVHTIFIFLEEKANK